MLPRLHVSADVCVRLLLCRTAGLYDGVVVDSGDGVTHIVCVVDGTVPMNLCQRLDIAGRHVTDKLLSLMLARGYDALRAGSRVWLACACMGLTALLRVGCSSYASMRLCLQLLSEQGGGLPRHPTDQGEVLLRRVRAPPPPSSRSLLRHPAHRGELR